MKRNIPYFGNAADFADGSATILMRFCEKH